jgi:hydroxylysine kinase
VDLVAMRAAMTIIISAWRARKTPENAPYLLRNAPAAKALIRALTAIPREDARQRVQEALQGARA